MTKKEFIEKREGERDLWRNVVDNPLIWTVEDRKKASLRLTNMCNA